MNTTLSITTYRHLKTIPTITDERYVSGARRLYNENFVEKRSLRSKGINCIHFRRRRAEVTSRVDIRRTYRQLAPVTTTRALL